MMEYRPLGSTGLQVTSLSFGAASLGIPEKEIDEATSVRTVREVLDLGINLIDVSPYYGITRAESIVGKGIRGVPRDRFHLATKAGRYNKAEFDFTPERIRRSVEESLGRLGTDYVDILELHDIEFGDLDFIVNETLPVLHELRNEGKIRFFGVTGYPLKVFQYVLERTDIDTMLSFCHYTLLDTTLETLLPEIGRRGTGLINGSPLAMGLLTRRGPFPWHPAGEDIRAACRRAAEHCSDRGVNIARLALQFAVRDTRIPTTLVGSASPERMRENIAWLEEPYDSGLAEEVREILHPVLDRSWPSGRPENN